jgi:signal transduction histidine kinase
VSGAEEAEGASHESAAMTVAAPAAPASRWLRAPGRGLALCGLMLAGAALAAVLAVSVLALALAVTGGGMHTGRNLGLGVAGLTVFVPALPRALLAARWLATRTRRLAGEWCGVPIADPYRPPPPAAAGRGRPGRADQLRWLLTDQATWRDLLWLVVNAAGGWLLAALPAGLIGLGLIEFIVPVLYHGAPSPIGAPASPAAHPADTQAVLILLGAMLVAAGFAAGPRLLRAYGLLARALLGSAGNAALAERVQHLSQTRAETIDAGAAEMRRIERDLHDGAQARLVAMGMTLDAAGQLIGSDPAAARALVLAARDASALALAELRDPVRGIHPPVLADRGLAAAVRALALDSPLRVTVAGALPGRPPLPVESAAYFGVSELLANVSKHAGARQVWIEIRHGADMLRISVTDDGCGGADPARGSGLRGIQRRLAAFDGVAAVSSPPGGPTVVTMEMPCALSSPKTSSC